MMALHDALAELHAIAGLCCEATGEERGLRSALECVTAALASLRRYDARVLLRCPECGGSEVWALEDGGCRQGFCEDCCHKGPWRTSIVAALLAWHKVMP